MKICKVCTEVIVQEQRVKHPNAKDGYENICKSCKSIYAKHRRSLKTDVCDVSTCIKQSRTAGLCMAHYARKRKWGDVQADKPLRISPGTRGPFIDKDGYRQVRDPITTKFRAEHTVLMEQQLGRAMLAHENVHHINGMRSDNRLENLELWSKVQPAGQRVEDKVSWAIEILTIYKPELLCL